MKLITSIYLLWGNLERFLPSKLIGLSDKINLMETLESKELLHEYLKYLDGYPESQTVNNLSDVTIKSPYIIKPCDSSAQRGIYMVLGEPINEKIPKYSKWIAQKFIESYRIKFQNQSYRTCARTYVYLGWFGKSSDKITDSSRDKITDSSHDKIKIHRKVIISRLAQPDNTPYSDTYDSPGQDQYINRISKYQKGTGWEKNHYFEMDALIPESGQIFKKMSEQITELFDRLNESINTRCFVDIIIAVDWIIDQDLKPWILETNVAPNFRSYQSIITLGTLIKDFS